MKKIFITTLLAITTLFSAETKNSVSLDFYAQSHHLNDNYNYNEKHHNYLGINYKFNNDYIQNELLNNDFFTEISFSTFKNSYRDTTYLFGTTLGYNVLNFDILNDFNINVGGQLSLGMQKGYCNYGDTVCGDEDNNISPFIIPSLFTKFEDLKITYFYMPNVVGVKIGYDILKW